MSSKPPKQPLLQQDEKNWQSLLSASAEGAKFLILLQVSSRLLTFLVNQLLLQYLSPSLLGISVQLELFMISILFFSRESLRAALQRQPSSPTNINPPSGNLVEGTPAAHRQTVINLSLLTLPLGLLFALVLSAFYARSFASSETASQPFFYESVGLYALATIVELAAEPYFALAQLGLRYRARAAAESSAALTRCVLTCGVTIAASREKWANGIGPLGFAVGQVGYACVLLGAYKWAFRGEGIGKGEEWGVGLKRIEPKSTYHLGLFHKPLTSLAASIWLQSALKHILTQGDSLLITYFTTNHAQGVYAFSSNYGSLIARMLFQPIEESSRALFAKLLSPSPSAENTKSAANVLETITRLYIILSVFFVALAVPFAPVALSLIAGNQWATTDAGDTLSAFCYYIPLLAINGVSEAFVQSVATKGQLAVQSAWMFAFSIGFAGFGWVFLRYLDWGAPGLVAANGMNMLVRIIWSGVFVRGYFEKGKVGVEWSGVLPGWLFLSGGVGAGVLARGVVARGGGVLRLVGSAGVLGGALLGFCVLSEREFFIRCYRMARARGE